MGPLSVHICPPLVHTSRQSACPDFRTAKSPCIMCVQCIGGCSVHLLGFSGPGPSAAALANMKQRCATIFIREIGNFCGGEYSTSGECQVHWGMDTMSTLGDIMSTSGDVHHIGVFNINQRLLSTCSPPPPPPT